MKKVAIIIRGVSGCGKSTVAKYISDIFDSGTNAVFDDANHGSIICCADDYFEKDGKYSFSPEKLSMAHDWCLNKFKEAIDKNTPLVIQSNTNTKEWEFKKYLDYANEKGYVVFCLVVENRHGGMDSHNVPVSALQKQETNLRLNLRLRDD